jgi:hypothetical protein
LTRPVPKWALVTALLLGNISVCLAQIPAGDDIGYQNGAVSGRCVASDLVVGGTSIRILNSSSAVMNGIAIIALNLSRNACVSLNTPPGSVQLAFQAYGSGCAAIYYMVWQPHSRDPWLYWLGPADAHALMCTADTLSTTSPTDAAPTANVGSGTETTGKSLTTTAYLDHIYSIVCDDFSGTQAQKWAGPADSDLVFSANRTWGGQPVALPCYIAERRLKLPASTGTEAANLSTSVNWVEFIAAFRTFQPPVPRAEGDVAGILTKYAPTMYGNLAATFTLDGQTGFCSDCDPPSNPPKPCTSGGRKTGAYVHRLNGTNYCTY